MGILCQPCELRKSRTFITAKHNIIIKILRLQSLKCLIMYCLAVKRGHAELMVLKEKGQTAE